MNELKEQNIKWPRWFKDNGFVYMASNESDPGKLYGYAHGRWMNIEADQPLKENTPNLVEITAAEAADILRKRGDETWWSDSVKQALPCNGAEETNAPINPWHPIDDLRGLLVSDGDSKVELFNSTNDIIQIGLTRNLLANNLKFQYTHWRLHIPPPEKVVDEVEECRKAWFADNNAGGTITELLTFALNWAKERGKK